MPDSIQVSADHQLGLNRIELQYSRLLGKQGPQVY